VGLASNVIDKYDVPGYCTGLPLSEFGSFPGAVDMWHSVDTAYQGIDGFSIEFVVRGFETRR
jgi:hypothetical protein